MTVNRRKKVGKLRGSRMHGKGIKKGRGAGNRGGRGMAGTGKRAAQKKPSILTQYGNAYFGKHGFTRPQKTQKKEKTLNLQALSKFSSSNINLTELGYTKLLGSGSPNQAYTITVSSFSKKAKEKIEAAGGSIQG